MHRDHLPAIRMTGLLLFAAAAFACVAVNPATAAPAATAGADGLTAGAAGTATTRVFIVAQNRGTEITDLLVPFALLSHASELASELAAEQASGSDGSSAAPLTVEIVATDAGPVNFWPALSVEPHAVLDDRTARAGDLVIVPAVLDPEDSRLIPWLQQQYRQGAGIVSICDGVMVLAAAGLLDGRRATGHFYSHGRRVRKFPEVRWEQDHRWLEDGSILSTAGVSASAPGTLRLVERLLGTGIAAATARDYGIAHWNPAYETAHFRIGAAEAWLYVRNLLRGVTRHRYRIDSSGALDEYALALTVDLLARTSRVSIDLDGRVGTRHGLTLSGRDKPTDDRARMIGLPGAGAAEDAAADDGLWISDPAATIPAVLEYIGTHYGAATADFVALQLELPVRDRTASAATP